MRASMGLQEISLAHSLMIVFNGILLVVKLT